MGPRLPSVLSLHTHPWRSFLLLAVLLVAALYGQTLDAPFVYDDLDQVLNNPNLGTWADFTHRFLLHPVSLTTSFLNHTGSTYRPLFWFSLFLDHTLWGLNPAGFHATNLLLHLLNGILAFALLQRLRLPPTWAALTALLWLALPLNTEAVAWISGRAYLLCTAFILLALLSALRYAAGGTKLWLAITATAAIAAALSHELGLITLPLLLLLPLATDTRWQRRHTELACLLGLALLALFALRLAVGVQSFSGIASPTWSAQALGDYLALAIFPLHLSVERSTSLIPGQLHPGLLLAAAALLLALVYAVIQRTANPLLLTGLAWFLLCLAPFVLLTNYQGLAERFAYLATLGLTLAVTAAIRQAAPAQLQRAAVSLLALWSVCALARTATRAADWADPIRLYRASLEANPNSPSLHYNLAFSLRERGDPGDLDQAIPEYQRTLALAPTYPHALASLGDIYLRLNRYAEAQATYARALAQNPRDTDVLLNSGAAFQAAGQPTQAADAWEHVLQIDPTNSPAHVNLGVLALNGGQLNEAMHQFAMAIDLKSKDPVPYYDLGALFQKAGRGDLALALYKKVLELKPNDPDTLHNLQLLEAKP